MHSKSLRLFAIIAVAAALLLSGCRGKQKPDPSMTAVRGMGTGGASADWVSGQEIDSAGGLGLTSRDPNALGDGNRIENLFSPIYFDFDQSFIRPSDRGTLQEVAAYLGTNPTHKLLVEGHCDWRGTTEYNMALGDRRANSVTSYLSEIGVTADRMETVSKGDLEAVTEGSEDQMQLDRRADLVIIP